MPKKPSCSDYIVAAIKELRPKRKDLKPGACAGKELYAIYSLAKQRHSERVFRQSLNVLMESGTVVLVAQVTEIQKSLGEDGKRDVSRLRNIPRVPASAPLEKSIWHFNSRGKSVDPEKREHVRCMQSIMLYVVTDGLPASVERAVSGKGMTADERIMASLMPK